MEIDAMQQARLLPFDVSDGRAMVSLGPLSKKKYCPYRCPFCYVRGQFLSYASLSTPDILSWLRDVSEPYNIVYVSGDTDSFAPPRTNEGLALLESLSTLGIDVLFTSRFVFSEDDVGRIERIGRTIGRKNGLLFGCVSVAQMTVPHLEPPPIRSAAERLRQLGRFREIGIVPVLAMRPFLPVVPNTDYTSILEIAAQERVSLVLGGAWFADMDGVIERGVFQGPTPDGVTFGQGEMDFDSNEAVWKVYKSPATEAHVRQQCERLGLAYFDRSGPMIKAVRAKRQNAGVGMRVEAPS